MNKKQLIPVLFAACAFPASHAAVVVWSAAQNVSADTDILTTGTLVQALNLGTATSLDINGVTFTGNTNPSWGNANFTGYGAHPVGGNYGTALSTGRYVNGTGSTASITFSGLTIGQAYTFQVWFNDIRDTTVDTMAWDSGASTTNVTLQTTGTGSLAQYALGSFTADATTQLFRGTATAGGGGATANMYQLRAVPEPSTYGLIGAGALAGVAFIRRRRRA